jgi:hypothetical protein
MLTAFIVSILRQARVISSYTKCALVYTHAVVVPFGYTNHLLASRL